MNSQREMLRLSLLTLVGLRLICGEVYTSVADFQEVLSIENSFVQLLQDHINRVEDKLHRIKRYLHSFYHTMDAQVHRGAGFSEKFVQNPIHAFQTVKRLTVDWKQLEEDMKVDDWRDLLYRMDEIRSWRKFPQEEDFHGVSYALILVQDTYNLNISDLSRGFMAGMQTYSGLTAQDCFYMGRLCYHSGLYSRAMEWLEEAYQLAGLEGNRTVRQDVILQYLDHTLKTMDDYNDETMDLMESQIQQDFPEYADTSFTPEEDLENYALLCRGEKLLDIQKNSQLKCWLDDRNNHYYILHPIKVEEQYQNPHIVYFHDVISDREIDLVKYLAKPLLSRSRVQNYGHDLNTISPKRTSKTAWLLDNSHPLIQQLSERVGRITGLNTNSWQHEAELLQVVNYGIGGHYSPHHDYLLKDKSEFDTISEDDLRAGDRVATFMFYLSDVLKGGATAFPRLGISLMPRKGSAAFWYNLKRNGQPETLTLHGACPVLLGSKWVSNKWIRENSQIWRRPCSKNPHL